MKPAQYPLVLRLGAKYDRLLRFVDSNEAPLSLVGYSAVLTIRRYSDNTSILTINSSAISGYRLIIDGGAGTVRIYIPVSAVEIVRNGLGGMGNIEGLYDLSLIPPSGAEDAEDYLYGPVKVETP